MPGRSVRASTERLARQALRDEAKARAALVGAAAETQARIEAVLDDLLTAIDSHAEAITAAERGGWTRAHLRGFGIAADPAGAAGRAARRLRAPAGERTSPAAEGKSTPAASSAETPAAAGPAPGISQP